MIEFVLKPWHLLVLFEASRLNREQQRIIEYLQVENQVLREKLGKKRILLNNDQRRRLQGGSTVALGTSSVDQSEDWVVLLTREESSL